MGELHTIGHGADSAEGFLERLRGPGVERVVDIRALPGSRRSPQFNSDEMRQWLSADGVGYSLLADLGGRRRRQDVDPRINAGWRNASFKNYADYTMTTQFERGLDELTHQAAACPTAIMCGEPMPWRCHRLLVSNVLVARGWSVRHILTGATVRDHELGLWGATPVEDAGRVTYPDC